MSKQRTVRLPTTIMNITKMDVCALLYLNVYILGLMLIPRSTFKFHVSKAHTSTRVSAKSTIGQQPKHTLTLSSDPLGL